MKPSPDGARDRAVVLGSRDIDTVGAPVARRVSRLVIPAMLAVTVVAGSAALVAGCDSDSPQPSDAEQHDAHLLDTSADAMVDAAIPDAIDALAVVDAPVDAAPPDVAPDTPA